MPHYVNFHLVARQVSTRQVRPFQKDWHKPDDNKNLQEDESKRENVKTKSLPDGDLRETGFAALVGLGLYLGRGHTLTFHGMAKIQPKSWFAKNTKKTQNWSEKGCQ